MTPEVITRDVAGHEATTIRFEAYPKGAELFARVLMAAQPLLAAASPVLAGALKGLDPKVLQAVGAGQLSPLAALSPALLADAAPILDAIPAVIAAIVADRGLVADLLAQTTVIADGENHKLTSRERIGKACGYNYALLTGLIKFAVEVNFAGPLADAFGGRSRDSRGAPAAAPAA